MKESHNIKEVIMTIPYSSKFHVVIHVGNTSITELDPIFHNSSYIPNYPSDGKRYSFSGSMTFRFLIIKQLSDDGNLMFASSIEAYK
ncbi:UNVERIFIED_CONTAM: hypothetical protein RMT77_000586 [Armadillidium vulgare]